MIVTHSCLFWRVIVIIPDLRAAKLRICDASLAYACDLLASRWMVPRVETWRRQSIVSATFNCSLHRRCNCLAWRRKSWSCRVYHFWLIYGSILDFIADRFAWLTYITQLKAFVESCRAVGVVALWGQWSHCELALHHVWGVHCSLFLLLLLVIWSTDEEVVSAWSSDKLWTLRAFFRISLGV